MNKRIFFIEHVVQVFLLTRVLCTHLIPLHLFVAEIVALMYLKYQI